MSDEFAGLPERLQPSNLPYSGQSQAQPYVTFCQCGQSSVTSTVELVSYIGPCCLDPGERPRPHISLADPLGRLGDDEA